MASTIGLPKNSYRVLVRATQCSTQIEWSLQWKILSFQWTLQREKGESKEGGVPQANTIQTGVKTMSLS